MNRSSEGTTRRWPAWLMAATLFTLGLVPMANLVAPGRGLEWWNQSVRLWTLWALVVGAAATLLARLAPRACDALPALTAWLILRPPRRLFVVLLATMVCALAVFFSWHLFGLQPLTIDELSLQWHGRLLASGHLFARAERFPEFFSTTQTVIVGDRWFSHFPIGPVAVLAVGMGAGLPWLINPVLTAIGALILYRFLASTTSELEARAATLLFASSPFVLFMAATQLDHVPALVAIWMAIAALPGWARADTPAQARRHAAVVGAGLGVAATIRPYDAALCAIVIGLFQLRELRRDRRVALASSLVVQVAAGCIPVALLLAANAATTGDPLTFAYDSLNGHAHRPGFHVDPMGELHTPRRGVFLVSAYLLRLDATLLGWPVPALLLVILALAWQKRTTRWDELLLGLLGALLVGYWVFWGEGRALGPRFLFTVAPVFLLYATRFAGAIRERITRPLWRRAATVLVPIWLLLGWLLPAPVAQPSGVWALARRARERPEAARLIENAVVGQGLHNALVFVVDGWRARLLARLTALGARPFAAQKIIEHHDACMLQQLLDSADHMPGGVAARSSFVYGAIDRAGVTPSVPGLGVADQIALEPGRALPAACSRELAAALSNGVNYERFLPHNGADDAGRLSGDVLYARDFGTRNVLLRDRFADRAWYRARVERVDGTPRAVIEPMAH